MTASRLPENPPGKTLSLVIPCYEEEESLPFLMERLQEVECRLDERGVGLQLILVDDGSGDGTFPALRRAAEQRPGTTVVKLSRNFGAWPACSAGLEQVRGDALVFLSADLQDPPELVVQMVDHWLEGHKFVICARSDRDDPWLSKLSSDLYYKLVRWMIAPDFPRGGYDIALMDRQMLPYLRRASKHVNQALLAYWLGFSPKVIPYHRPGRAHGASGWSLARRITFFIDSLLGFSVVPIRLMSLLGLLVSGFSAFYGLWVVVDAIRGQLVVQGFATTVALICFLLGIVIFMLGIIGEYLWRIFDEVSRRPEVVVDEVYTPEARE